MKRKNNSKNNKRNKYISFKTKKYPEISVIICTFNDRKYLRKSISSILNQTFRDFELIIFDDGSTENIEKIVKSFNDARIQFIKLNKNMGSIGKTRSVAVSYATGLYCFFTDGDCFTDKNWLKVGLDAFKRHNAMAVEGKIIYVKEGYQSCLSDKGGANEIGGCWMTGNMAYRRSTLAEHNFNPNLTSLEDRELGLRISRLSPIPFISNFKVYHMKKQRFSIFEYLKETNRYKIKVQLIKNYGDTTGNKFRIINPKFLLVMFCPFLILGEFYYGRIKSWDDIKLLPFVWIKAIYLRYIVWSTAIKEKVFVI